MDKVIDSDSIVLLEKDDIIYQDGGDGTRFKITKIARESVTLIAGSNDKSILKVFSLASLLKERWCVENRN
jgi:hypothetical protein